VLLVEGNSHISEVITKYLTQSTRSHAALHVGVLRSAGTGEEQPHMLVEASLEEGVAAVPLQSIFSSALEFADASHTPSLSPAPRLEVRDRSHRQQV
jgi:hypothetical protein